MEAKSGFASRFATFVCVLLLVTACATMQPAKIIDPQELARGTYVIGAPGHYRLAADAKGAGSPAIRIAASNVTLDLGGYALSTGAGAGIEINGVSNVTVTNGSLREIAGAGILLVCDVAPPARRCSDFSITRLEMRNVGKSGEYGDLDTIFNRPFSGGLIVFGRSTPVPVAGDAWENSITGVTVSRVTVRNDPLLKHLFSGSPPAGGQNGLTFVSVTNLRVEDIGVFGMTSNDAAACIFLGRTKAVAVRRFECNGATGERNANGLDSMSNVQKPLSIKKNYDVRVEDSTFSNIRAIGERGNEALGVELNGEKFAFDRVTVTDVVNDSTTAAGNRAIGFQIVSNAESKEVSSVTNCAVRNVTHHGNGKDSRAGGVSIEAAPPIVVRGCSVSNVSNLASATASIKAFGYRVDPGANKVTFENNSSDNVTAPAVAKSANPVPGYVAGFAFIGAEVEMSGNRSSHSHAGLFARKLAPDSSIRGNRFECNRLGVDDAGAGLLKGTENVVAAAGC